MKSMNEAVFYLDQILSYLPRNSKKTRVELVEIAEKHLEMAVTDGLDIDSAISVAVSKLQDYFASATIRKAIDSTRIRSLYVFDVRLIANTTKTKPAAKKHFRPISE
jgi:hypothetical protein